MKKILVTGGAGFVGSHTVELLVKNGYHVRVLDNLCSGAFDNLKAFQSSVEFMKGDICSDENCEKAIQGCESVLHLAGVVSVPFSIKNPELDQTVNLEASLRLLRVARHVGVRRFVFASSASVYGNVDTSAHLETDALYPMSPYASAKAAVEQYLCSYAHVYGMTCVALRYFNIYGSRQDPRSPYSGVISLFLQAIREGKPIKIFGTGKQTRDFIYVKDVARANLMALCHEELCGFHVINIGTGHTSSLLELLEALKTQMGDLPEIAFHPTRSGDIFHSCPDVNKAENLLDYETSYKLQEGLTDWLNPPS